MTPHRPGLLWRLTDYSKEVDYGRFTVVDDEAEQPDLGSDGPGSTELATGGDGWIALRSGGSGHNPTITLEGWEHEPPDDSQSWADQAELDIAFVSGTLRLWGVASGPSQGPSFVLPYSGGGSHRVRVHCRSAIAGRSVADLVVELADDDDREDGLWDLEEWLLQFWPAGS